MSRLYAVYNDWHFRGAFLAVLAVEHSVEHGRVRDRTCNDVQCTVLDRFNVRLPLGERRT